jgi:hypothetical protein
MVGATESAPRESGSPRRAGLRCMLMSVERSCVPVVDSRDDPVTVLQFAPILVGVIKGRPQATDDTVLRRCSI